MKRFLIVGNINVITYANVFPHIKSCEVHYRPECYGIKCYYNTDVKVTATWYTTLIPPYIPPLVLTKSYTPEAYPRYDNYNAIEVSKTKDIPYDYQGVMGVPITFLDKYCPEQFEIVGCFNGYKECDYENGLLCGEKTEYFDKNGKIKIWTGPTIDKKTTYFRILIRNRKLN